MENPSKETSRCYLPKRYIVTVLGFIGMFNTYAMRVNLSVAMVAMVNNTHDIANDSRYAAECPAQSSNQEKNYTDFKGERYNWDSTMQGWIMSSFFYGYFITVLLGGYAAERFVATRVFGGGIFFTSVLTLLTPLAVKWGVVPLMIIRALEGLGEGVTFPAMTSIISRWSPKLERSRISSMIFSGAQVGNIIAMSVSGWLCSTDFLGGWPSVFYVFGFISCVWFFLWCIFVYETPHAHPSISQDELLLFRESGKCQTEKFKVPWRAIFRSVPFWAVMVSDTGFLFGMFMFLTELPTYLTTVHHFDIDTVGLMSAIPYITVCLGIWIASYVADRLRISGKMTITAIRKIFNSVGGYSPFICVIAITFSGCRPFLIVALFSLALFLKGGMFSGFHIILVDMCPDFAGTVFGLTNGVASLSGIIGPILVGYFTEGGYTIANWNKVFYVTGAIYFTTTTFFAVFASAELQPWGKAETADAICYEETENQKQDVEYDDVHKIPTDKSHLKV